MSHEDLTQKDLELIVVFLQRQKKYRLDTLKQLEFRSKLLKFSLIGYLYLRLSDMMDEIHNLKEQVSKLDKIILDTSHSRNLEITHTVITEIRKDFIAKALFAKMFGSFDGFTFCREEALEAEAICKLF